MPTKLARRAKPKALPQLSTGSIALGSRVRLACPDCAKSRLHGTITGIPVPGVADLVWDELWEGEVMEVKTASSIQPTYTINTPDDRLPLSRLVKLPVQTMAITDFVSQHGDCTDGFQEMVVYCGRRSTKYKLAYEGSPLGNPFAVKDCAEHLKATGKSASGNAPLRLACNQFKELLRQTLNIHLFQSIDWRKINLHFPDSVETGNLLTLKQVQGLIEQDYREATISPETVIARLPEYDGIAWEVVKEARAGWLTCSMMREYPADVVNKRVNHQAIWTELMRMVQAYRSGRNLVLLCWCQGHCHTYAIARAVEYLAGQDV